MSTTENKTFIRRYLNALSGKDKTLAVMNLYIADSDEALKQHILAAEAGFPRYELIADDLVAEGDKVVVRATMRATHKGEFMGIAPTGKEVTISLMLIYRLANRKIAEHWMVMDALGLMQQLGVVPQPA